MIMENTNEVNSIKNDCNNPLFKISDPFCFIDLTENNEIKKEVIEDELPLKIEDSDGPKQTEDRPVEIFLNDFNEVKSESGALKTEYEDENVISYEENSNRAVEIHSDDSNETKRIKPTTFCLSDSEYLKIHSNEQQDEPSIYNYTLLNENDSETNDPLDHVDGSSHVDDDPMHAGTHFLQISDNEEQTNHPNGNELSCKTCDYNCQNWHELAVHAKIHTNENLFRDLRQEPTENLTHIKTRTLYQCARCKITFFRRHDMMTHKLIHRYEKKYSCSECDYKCNKKGELIFHERSHKRKKLYRDPFVCEDCGTVYVGKYAFDIHVLSHLSVFSCTRCDFQGGRRCELVNHIRTAHQSKVTAKKETRRKRNSSNSQQESKSDRSVVDDSESRNFEIDSETEGSESDSHAKVQIDPSKSKCSQSKLKISALESKSSQSELKNSKNELENRRPESRNSELELENSQTESKESQLEL